MEQVTTDWKKQLKHLHLSHIEREHPEAFRLSGGYKMKVNPYNDSTANGLTKAIIDFIRFTGGDAQRINTTGTMRRVNGTMKWTHSGVRRGTADIHAIVNGRAVSIEIKIGKDRMSAHQSKERERIIHAGGLYFVATSMPDFLQWYHDTFNKIQSH